LLLIAPQPQGRDVRELVGILPQHLPLVLAVEELLGLFSEDGGILVVVESVVTNATHIRMTPLLRLSHSMLVMEVRRTSSLSASYQYTVDRRVDWVTTLLLLGVGDQRLLLLVHSSDSRPAHEHEGVELLLVEGALAYKVIN